LAKYQTTNNKRPAMKSKKLTSLRILSPRGVSTELVNVRNVSMPL
jgi:ribosomal protein L14E/L6E/L27E